MAESPEHPAPPRNWAFLDRRSSREFEVCRSTSTSFGRVEGAVGPRLERNLRLATATLSVPDGRAENRCGYLAADGAPCTVFEIADRTSARSAWASRQSPIQVSRSAEGSLRSLPSSLTT